METSSEAVGPAPMDKSPEAFRTISEVAEALDVPPHVLRFWETRFVQVKPVKRGGGRRYYRPEDVRLLRGIRGLLYDDGMTIKGVQKILRERGIRHVIGLGTVAARPRRRRAVPAAVPAPMPPRVAGCTRQGAARPPTLPARTCRRATSSRPGRRGGRRHGRRAPGAAGGRAADPGRRRSTRRR